MTSDAELLGRYARTRSEDAFAELVQRHVNLVYSAALRQVGGDAHLAQDVAQTVFTDLARKAGSLARRESLTGWLYTSAHFAAAKIARTENRRRDREERFMREPANEPPPDASCAEALAEVAWERIRPALDGAMHELRETDREAILLRYFENRQFAEVGEKIGLSENAARMRVERALEKLRDILTKRGITTATALASMISANAVQLAPANLAATLTTTSIAAAGTGSITLLKILTATQLKLGVSALVLAGAATALVVQHQTQTKLRAENESLTQQVAQLKADNESLSNQLAAVGDSKSLSDAKLNELLKLRAEVGALRRQLESQRAQEVQQSASSREANTAHLAPSAYISKDQLTNAGLATPEAALQTYMHGILSANYDEVTNATSPQIPGDTLNPESLANASNTAALSLQGIEMHAKKTVSDDNVEVELVVFLKGEGPVTSIEHMVKQGNLWKHAGSAKYSSSWSEDGRVQLLTPSANQ